MSKEGMGSNATTRALNTTRSRRRSERRPQARRAASRSTTRLAEGHGREAARRRQHAAGVAVAEAVAHVLAAVAVGAAVGGHPRDRAALGAARALARMAYWARASNGALPSWRGGRVFAPEDDGPPIKSDETSGNSNRTGACPSTPALVPPPVKKLARLSLSPAFLDAFALARSRGVGGASVATGAAAGGIFRGASDSPRAQGRSSRALGSRRRARLYARERSGAALLELARVGAHGSKACAAIFSLRVRARARCVLSVVLGAPGFCVVARRGAFRGGGAATVGR